MRNRTISAHAVYNILLTLPTFDGWADRFISWVTPKGSVSFACHTRLDAPPLTQAALEAALTTQAGSLHPLDVSARKEMRRARR